MKHAKIISGAYENCWGPTDNLMTSTQLRKLLDRAGLSQRGAARELQIDERTMRRYCASDGHIPKVIEYALMWLAHGQVP